jgi:hypothetical protein
MNENRILGWDDEVEEESGVFILIPEGDYVYTVKKFEKAYYDGGAKLPACPKAEMTFTIHSPEGDVDIVNSFFLCGKCEWSISAFFLSVGLKKHGEKCRMVFDQSVGKKGLCRVYQESYVNRNGAESKSNKIYCFYDYEEYEKRLAEFAIPTTTETPAKSWKKE